MSYSRMVLDAGAIADALDRSPEIVVSWALAVLP